LDTEFGHNTQREDNLKKQEEENHLQAKRAVYNTLSQPSGGTNPANILTLDLQLPEL
jgi:hypothetical protein